MSYLYIRTTHHSHPSCGFCCYLCLRVGSLLKRMGRFLCSCWGWNPRSLVARQMLSLTLASSLDSSSTLQGHSRKKWRNQARYSDVLPASNGRNPKVAGPLCCFFVVYSFPAICPSCTDSHSGWCRTRVETGMVVCMSPCTTYRQPGRQLQQKMACNSSLKFN